MTIRVTRLEPQRAFKGLDRHVVRHATSGLVDAAPEAGGYCGVLAAQIRPIEVLLA